MKTIRSKKRKQRKHRWVFSGVIGKTTMATKVLPVIILALHFSAGACFSQTVFNVDVSASTITEVIPPLWRDHYENHLMHGYGGNPSILGPHTSIVADPNFEAEMELLQPRFIRVSIGRADNPPDTNYYSTDTQILKNLPYEFYKGANNLSAANDLGNYNFNYIDSMITLVQSIGAEPFITLDYMPFTLSSDTVPNYQAAMGLVYNLAYDNSIRNAPPANNAVYGRVMYHLIKHCYEKFGVAYFEHWNEPDQNWLNPVMVKFFWTGDEYQLYDAYKAMADEVAADAALADHVKLGGCSFALYSIGNLIPIRFLTLVKDNATKFDFLSFHPYSDTQFKGGYDSSKVALVQSWKETYVPQAELINGEWGRIDQNTDTWGGLDYGLNKVEHIIDMLDRNVTMSFEVALFDQETSTDNYTYLGMYRVGPIVPKPSAYVFYNLNKMNDALHRLPLTTSNGLYSLAGRNTTSDKVMIVVPAPGPVSGYNEVRLHVSALPWGNGPFHAKRSELTEHAYLQGELENTTLSVAGNDGAFSDTVRYPSVSGSGRLIVWELTAGTLSVSAANATAAPFTIYPNPAVDEIHLQFNELPVGPYSISIFNTLGKHVYEEHVSGASKHHRINADLKTGIYFIQIVMNGEVSVQKVVMGR